MHESQFIYLTLAIVLAKHTGAIDHRYCDDLVPQNDIDIEQLMGIWYGIEHISHVKGNIFEPHIEYSNTCFGVEIKERTKFPSTTNRYQLQVDSSVSYLDPFHRDNRYRYLIIHWEEPGNDLIYHVKFNNTRRGFWQSTAPENGDTLNKEYNHFAGTVQVLKAVHNHLVLSFCQRLPSSQLFSIILSRSPHQLSEFDIISVHNLLNRKNLPTSHLRKVCNGCTVRTVSLYILLVSMMLLCLIRMSE